MQPWVFPPWILAVALADRGHGEVSAHVAGASNGGYPECAGFNHVVVKNGATALFW
jgi:hypothetical protein